MGRGTAHGGQGLLILGKGRGGDQRFPGAEGKGQPENQVRRTVAAHDPSRRNPVPPGDGRRQFPAKGVRIVLRAVDGPPGGLFDRFRHTQGIQVGGKVQHHPVLARTGRPEISAVGIISHGKILP